MKKLASYLKRYTKESILAPLFKLLEVVFDLMVPLVVARMINIGVAGNDRGYMVRCFLILILMALLGLAASITAQFFAAKASTGFAADLRQAVFDHIQGFSFTELDTLGADTMITRLTDASAESLMLSTIFPLSEKLLKALRKMLTMMITLPARRTKPFRRCQVWIIRLLTCGT